MVNARSTRNKKVTKEVTTEKSVKKAQTTVTPLVNGNSNKELKKKGKRKLQEEEVAPSPTKKIKGKLIIFMIILIEIGRN